MDYLGDERRKQLSELEDFIKKSTDQLNSVLDTLGWTRDVLLREGADMVPCPLNPEHRMPQRSLKRHLEKCSLHQEGYRSDEEFLSASEFSSGPSVVIDQHNLNQILKRPTTMADSDDFGKFIYYHFIEAALLPYDFRNYYAHF
ncbi:U11/U12 small nuclear ribonucleoprotein 48 kDa protein-like [Frankliniella occidentalis]|uniref:U11/U12 small nuclear ribonucleoprotein 48 kDa protein-like n=1 Tax=Frankliniella occidentalis TaxID=133901 RepID=A0A6J1TL38_FRAOC|nr:U11/U12 small nuclear ribonucleoprotein 48 kDa protein-like [Frankliniella occidentalis]